MSPLSGLSAPERILISVDFPAPLSPSNPTISFLRTESVTSLSAWTRPKYLLMRSMRTSSSAISSSRAVPTFETGVKRHNPKDNRADENIIGKTRNPDQDNAVSHHPQDQHSNNCTDDCPAAAG